MGFSVTFAAVPLGARDAFLDAAGLQVTDQDDADGIGLISAAEHEDHFLIWRNLRAAPTFSDPDWQTLSKAAPLVVLDVVDSAGAQVLRGFDAGKEAWEISFLDTNDDLLAVKGTPPFDVEAKRQHLRAEHLMRYPEDAAEDDDSLIAGYGMVIPSRIFEDFTGLYYEDGPPEGLRALSNDLPLTEPAATGHRKAPSSKPWWKIW